MSEKRRWFRVRPGGRVAPFGKILLPGSRETIECRVIDLSAGGACLELSTRLQLPTHFEFQHGGTRKICALVWVRGYRVGIRYDAATQRALSDGLSRVRREKPRFSHLSR
ncbi:MAG: PilZ domain-containing protein [Pseudolabrys sp.]|nr:PilZ domain-containing protein [Pseudolabrys sp.]